MLLYTECLEKVSRGTITRCLTWVHTPDAFRQNALVRNESALLSGCAKKSSREELHPECRLPPTVREYICILFQQLTHHAVKSIEIILYGVDSSSRQACSWFDCPSPPINVWIVSI